MIDPRHCDRFEERLPLLRYPGELTDSERRQVLAHLEGCAACRRVEAGFQAAADSLDDLPLDLPSAEQQTALRASILRAVGADACPRELDPLEPTPDLRAHLASCEGCRLLDRDIELIVGLLAQQAPVPSLTEAQSTGLRDRVLAAVDLVPACEREQEMVAEPDPAHLASCASCAELAQVPAALDLVAGGALPAIDVTERVLARVAISDAEHAEDLAAVGPALDLLEVPAHDAAALRERILAATVAQPVAADDSDDAPAGQLLRFPGWVVRAAAAVLFAGTVGLGGYLLQDGPWVPADPASNLAHALEQEAELAEKLARASDEAPDRAEVLQRAERRFAGVVRQAEPQLSDPRVANVALRARNQLRALRMVTKASTAAGSTQQPEPTRLADLTEQSLLVSYGQVVREHPDSLATLWVLKKLKRALRGKGAIKFDLRDVRPANQNLARFLQSTRSRSRRELLRDDYAELNQLVSVALIQDTGLRQAVLLQQGIHAQELGNAADAERHFRDAIAIDPATRAGKLAQERLDGLTIM